MKHPNAQSVSRIISFVLFCPAVPWQRPCRASIKVNSTEVLSHSVEDQTIILRKFLGLIFLDILSHYLYFAVFECFFMLTSFPIESKYQVVICNYPTIAVFRSPLFAFSIRTIQNLTKSSMGNKHSSKLEKLGVESCRIETLFSELFMVWSENG